MMQRFRDWLTRFMYGRYGNDTLNQCLSTTFMVCLLISWLTHLRFLYWVALVLLGICYFRMLSYNREKRYAENLLFLNKTQGIRAWLERQKAAALQKSRDKAARNGQNNGYKIFRCPRCGQQLRVPKGRGRIEILCPKCQAHFVKKS